MNFDLRLGDYREVLANVGMVDAVITDCPYSDRTHAAAAAARRDPSKTRNPEKIPGAIGYARWSEGDVAALVDALAPRCRGWFCSITDHILAREWERSLERHGRYVFSPLACVEPGSRIRLVGDGPAQWSTWLVVARPKTREFASWGSLPGGYIFTEDRSTRVVVGGKPLPLMRAIVRDYTRPGDLVCDPTAGGGTTLLAAMMEGRRAIGAELDPVTHAKALNRLTQASRQESLFARPATKPQQGSLL